MLAGDGSTNPPGPAREPDSNPLSWHGDDQPEPDPSTTQPTAVREPPTDPIPIPINQILLDSGDPLGYPFPVTTPPSLAGLPPDQVWRAPGTF
jgi:hypothetical protein